MARLPQVSGREVIKALNKIGFVVVSQTGSHLKLRRKQHAETQTVIVPNHRIVRKGTLHGILRLAHLSHDRFTELLRK